MISMLLADDHPIVREGVRLLLKANPEINVVGQAGDGLEAVQMAVELSPDIIILDLMMPRLDGLEACLRIRRLAPTVKILVLSIKDTYHYLEHALQAGAMGFVLKVGSCEELLSAVDVVMSGEIYLSPILTSLFVRRHFERETERADRASQLTEREVEVLRLVATGFTNSRISETLRLSIKTVQSHRSNILTKLSLHDRVDLVKYAIRIGLVSGDDSLP